MTVRDQIDDVVIARDHLTPATSGTTAILDVRIRFTPTLPVVWLAGEVDLSSQHLLTDAVDCIIAASCPAGLVALDLSDVTFCDVAGVRAMEASAVALAAAGKELLIHHPPPPVTKLIAMSGRLRSVH
jgi:anti-anti-sigma factor